MLLKSDKDLKIDLKASEFELLVPANNKDIAIKIVCNWNKNILFYISIEQNKTKK